MGRPGWMTPVGVVILPPHPRGLPVLPMPVETGPSWAVFGHSGEECPVFWVEWSGLGSVCAKYCVRPFKLSSRCPVWPGLFFFLLVPAIYCD